jgi:hypothetical protein
MSPRGVIGKCAVRNCGEAYTDWNHNPEGGADFFLHNSKQKPSPKYRGIKTDWGRM